MKSSSLKTALLFAFLALFASLGAAQPAAVGPVREEPGATLLLPYFEIDLTSSTGRTTRFSINDASAAATMAHVTIWTEMAIPVFAFDVYLTGYDVQSIDLRNVLNGNLPQTASAGQDSNDAISPKGAVSQDINFASCTGTLPLAPLDAATVSAIQNALTGAPSSLLGGLCGARSSPGVARGYVTIDQAWACTDLFPNNPLYYSSGVLGFANVLWGDFSISNETEPLQGTPLVAIGANTTDPVTTTAGNYTFYGRYNGWSATDARAPLATGFLGRYTKNSTTVLAWRDPKVDEPPFACGGVPSWFPLGQEGIVFFDEAEHVVVPQVYPVAPQPPHFGILPFPAAAQRALAGMPKLPVSFASGWAFFDLNTTVIPAGNNPPTDSAASQAWLVFMEPIRSGTATVGLVGSSATQYSSATHASHFVP
jgi:hypothetical protein